MDKVIRIGIVGAGHRGLNLIQCFSKIGQFRVACVCDTCPDRLKALKTMYPQIGTYSDVDALLRHPKLSAVVVATPPDLHYEIALKSLRAHKDTFVEKPLALSSDQGEELLRLSRLYRRVLMVNHTPIYGTDFEKLKAIVDSGEIGRLLYISTKRLNSGWFKKEVNVAWDLAALDLAAILELVGDSPLTLNCQGSARLSPGNEDVTNISLQFGCGCSANVRSSWLHPQRVNQMVLVGSRKMVLYDENCAREKIKVYDKRVEATVSSNEAAVCHYAYHRGDVYAPRVIRDEPLTKACQHFLTCLQNRETPRSGAREGLQVVRILEAASLSLKQKGALIKMNRMEDGLPVWNPMHQPVIDGRNPHLSN